ncbi:DUF2306 domain-containing protein [Aquisphaera insulae]|uniref:DUF2306 domain-containing protein n=1 Tax=Aquisphaera insulae TaxID=2712864 RepID=UPI0013EC3541|nr:DUF2306 domain-containing protein [Aquisphaera insulae]
MAPSKGLALWTHDHSPTRVVALASRSVPTVRRLPSLSAALAFAAGLLVLKVTAGIVSNYVDYFPPDFHVGFLRGREPHFWGPYRWAFYAHVLSGPLTLVLGLVLVNSRLRARWPRWHRRIGWIQVGCVVVLLAPGGLWMARYAEAGPVAGAGLATLAILTFLSAVLGVHAARRRRFADHRRWMWRLYLLLCSAVVLRLLGGLAVAMGITASWYDPLANWINWLAPLAGFEIWERVRRRFSAS